MGSIHSRQQGSFHSAVFIAPVKKQCKVHTFHVSQESSSCPVCGESDCMIYKCQFLRSFCRTVLLALDISQKNVVVDDLVVVIVVNVAIHSFIALSLKFNLHVQKTIPQCNRTTWYLKLS